MPGDWRTMTMQPAAAMPAAMLHRAWILLLCLLASSLMATATLHAQESYGSAGSVSCEGTAHTEADADQVPADGDQPFPHHHATCHGHGLSTAGAAPAIPPVAGVRELPSATDAALLAKRKVGPALEPPRA
jgi:hypothetical protein